jgi:hypothetical protein
MATTYQIIDWTGLTPVGFTGIVHARGCTFKAYGAAIGGEMLRQKNGRKRWFNSVGAAAKAIKKINVGE